MSDTLESLRRKIAGARDLGSVVRTMKVLAASCIGQYERAAAALDDYCRAVELGLAICFRGEREAPASDAVEKPSETVAVVFGSDQGLVGRFNETLAGFAAERLVAAGTSVKAWAVGERAGARMADAGYPPQGVFEVPGSVSSITRLVGRILTECETAAPDGGPVEFVVFYNAHLKGPAYEPVFRRLLPLDGAWRREISKKPWPTKYIPEVMPHARDALGALVREYLFIVLFRACAESLASENASRLAAMQRAEKNIGEMLEQLGLAYNRLRQDSIDAELFDVIAGFEALAPRGRKRRRTGP